MTDQPLTSTSAAQVIAIGNTSESSGVSIQNGDEVTFAYAGTYSLTFSIQITNYANSVEKAIFWVKTNNVDYPDSATEIDLQPRKAAGNPNRQVITINYVATATAGQQVQVYWSGSSTELKVESLPAGTSPVSPAVPSIIITAVQVMYTQVGPQGNDGADGAPGATGPSGSVSMNINAQTGTAYTLVAEDLGYLVTLDNASAVTLTVPTDTVPFAVGSMVTILQRGVGQVTVAATSPAVVNSTPGLKLRAQWSSAALVKLASNSWVLLGDTVA
jgi:hypothetical protein